MIFPFNIVFSCLLVSVLFNLLKSGTNFQANASPHRIFILCKTNRTENDETFFVESNVNTCLTNCVVSLSDPFDKEGQINCCDWTGVRKTSFGTRATRFQVHVGRSICCQLLFVIGKVTNPKPKMSKMQKVSK